MIKKIFFILSLWFTFSSVHAFNVTNVISKNDSSKIFYFYTSDIDSLNPVDTSVKYFYRYNPIQQYTDFFTRSGNTGLPYKNLFFIKIAGGILFALGAVFAAWSLIIFRKAPTTTTPGESSKKLVTWGPYRFTRNPMYVSLTLAYLGEAGMLSQFWPVLVLPFMLAYVNQIVIPLEEGILKRDYDNRGQIAAG